MAASLNSKQERLVRVTKEEVEENVAKAIFEKEEAIKALEEEKADRKAAKKIIKVEAKEEAVGDICHNSFPLDLDDHKNNWSRH